jgi:hypothetical protein
MGKSKAGAYRPKMKGRSSRIRRLVMNEILYSWRTKHRLIKFVVQTETGLFRLFQIRRRQNPELTEGSFVLHSQTGINIQTWNHC